MTTILQEREVTRMTIIIASTETTMDTVQMIGIEAGVAIASVKVSAFLFFCYFMCHKHLTSHSSEV